MSPETLFSRSQTFPGNYNSLAEIGKFIRLSAQEAGLSDFAVYMVETAVDEACSNVIEHAYGGENKGSISITCQDYPNNLTVLIRDSGRPFDPKEIPTPRLDMGLEDLPGHGLGLFFMRKWMDEVHFSSSAGEGNLLTMVKYKEGQS